jgi:hypothetical protein
MSRSRDLADTGVKANYLDNVASDINTQLTGKAPLASPTFTGTTNISSGVTLPSSMIKQVLTAVDTDGTACSAGDHSSPSFVDCVTLSFTPSSGTKCIIFVDAIVGTSLDNSPAMLRVLRDSTVLDTSTITSAPAHTTQVCSSGSHSNVTVPHNRIIYDTHGANGSTAIEYKFQLARITSGTDTVVGRTYSDPSGITYRSTQATRITVLEVT